jgi:hypothetical protein
MPVCGDQWPMLVYADQEYDPQDPWEGLFKSRILVWVHTHLSSSSVGDVESHHPNVDMFTTRQMR